MNKERLKNLLAEFGRVGLVIYLILFALVLIGFVVAIQAGFHVASTAGTAGIWVSAWIATKLTQPLRILATLALTPVVAQVLKRWKKPPQDNANGGTEGG